MLIAPDSRELILDTLSRHSCDPLSARATHSILLVFHRPEILNPLLPLVAPLLLSHDPYSAVTVPLIHSLRPIDPVCAVFFLISIGRSFCPSVISFHPF